MRTLTMLRNKNFLITYIVQKKRFYDIINLSDRIRNMKGVIHVQN